nr:helix-turn-helix domain-containing protein [Rhodococcus sp. (in: high G+C Gram-positive bacteria)]
MTVADASERLGTTTQFVRALIHRGDLPAVYLNSRALRIKPADLEAWIESRSTPGAA